MPWKIVNLDYDTDKPHLHMKDPGAPIHLRTYFEQQRVEICLGADDPEDCFVRAAVTADDVSVQATHFQPLHVQILSSILASLDVEPAERDGALAWMQERLRARSTREDGMLAGNIEAFPPPKGWPYDLPDDALLDALGDREGAPHTRINALLRETRRRGLRVPAPSARLGAVPPEIVHRRPNRG